MWWGARAIYCGWNKEEAGSLCIGLMSLAFNSRSARKYRGVHGGQTHPGRFTPCNINVEPRQQFWTSEKEFKKVFDVGRSHLRIRRNASIIGNHLGFQTRTTTLQGRRTGNGANGTAVCNYGGISRNCAGQAIGRYSLLLMVRFL